MSKHSHQKHEHKRGLKHHVRRVLVGEPQDYHAGLFGDIVIILLIVGLGLFFVLPFYGVLPNPGNVIIMLLFLLIVAGFVVLVWRRKNRKKVK